jgi:hypothetical protein
MFHLFSDVCCKYVYLDVAYVSHICCKCFYLDVSYVCNSFQVFFHAFLQVFQINVSSVSSFFCMLQVLHLDVSKVDRMLHLPPRLLLPCLGVSSLPSAVLHLLRLWGGAVRDGDANVSTCSPLPSSGQVSLRFTFFLLCTYVEMRCSR